MLHTRGWAVECFKDFTVPKYHNRTIRKGEICRVHDKSDTMWEISHLKSGNLMWIDIDVLKEYFHSVPVGMYEKYKEKYWEQK